MKALSRPSLRNLAKIAVIVALLLLGGRLVLLYKDRADAAAAFENAQQFRAQNNFHGARVELMNAVRSDPELMEAYIAQAEIALTLFNGTQAREALEKALGRGLDPMRVQHLLGHALFFEGDLEGAESLLSNDEIPEKYRGYALRILGQVLMDLGNVDGARDSFNAALELGKDNSQLWTEIARFRWDLADQAGAIEAADHAVKLDPNNFRAIELRGRLVREQYGLAAALPWFERGLAIFPDDIALLEEYGVTLGELGRASDMLKVARRITSLSNRNGRAYFMQAVIAARAGEFGLAQRILALAGSQINETPSAMLVSAITEYQLGNYHKSADILGRLVNIQPQNLEARKLLARAKQSAGANFDALDAIKPLVDRGQADSYSAMIAARAFEATGDRGKAVGGLSNSAMAMERDGKIVPENLSLRMAEEGVRKNPGNAQYVIPYIRALMLAGQPEPALKQAHKLQKSAPGVPDAHILVGDVQLARGHYVKAVDAYQKARAIRFSEGVMLRLVDVYRRLGQHDNARIILAEFTQFNPNNVSAQRLIAYLMLDQGRWANAVPLLEKLRERVGYNDSILNANIARAYIGMGQFDDAIFNAKTAYKIDPANPMVTLVYGQSLLASGTRPKAALELFEKANILIPRNDEVIHGLKLAQKAFDQSQKKSTKKSPKKSK